MRRLIVTGLLGAGMALSANGNSRSGMIGVEFNQLSIGAEVAMQLVGAVNVAAVQNPGQTGTNLMVLYAAAAMVRGAQTALRQRQYYNGVTNGRLDNPTRRAIARYQIDNDEAPTGDLDHATVVSLGLGPAGTDSASNVEGLARQRAAEINRKAATLLATYQSKLGIRMDDIRYKVASEEDLDLLLQVAAFAEAASWYKESSRPGMSLGMPFSNFGRILLRSATRVTQAMERASQDQRFADTWSSIEANLHDIGLDKSFSDR